METADVMSVKCSEASCPVRIKFEYDKFNDKHTDIKIDHSAREGLRLKIKIKDEYSIKGKEIESVIDKVLSN